jgi:hypothetical protein
MTTPTLYYKNLSLYCFCDTAIVVPITLSQAPFYSFFVFKWENKFGFHVIS